MEHHVLEWGGDPHLGTVLLLHGYMDVAASWEWVAPALSEIGLRSVAPDLRGFGDAPRAPPGTHYYFPDYVADVVEILDAMGLPGPGPLYVVGHSMGGMVATLFAGAFPSRVAKLATLEGLGPPDNSFAVAPDRLRDFVTGARKYRRDPSGGTGAERSMADLDEALKRLAMNHPGVPEAALRARVPTLVRELTDGSGRFVWRFDPLHRARSPVPFYAGAFAAFASRIECPVLHVSGGATGYHPEGEAERLAAFRDLRVETLEGAGHMMHWTKPAELSALLETFLR